MYIWRGRGTGLAYFLFVQYNSFNCFASPCMVAAASPLKGHSFAGVKPPHHEKVYFLFDCFIVSLFCIICTTSLL